MRIRGLHTIRSAAAGRLLREDPPVENDAPPAEEDIPTDGRLATLEVNFSLFNAWYEIDSFWEGEFLERTVPGAFKRTIQQRGDQVKILFNHGMDLNIGDKVLSIPEVIEERETSPYIEGPLFDTSYNRDLLPGLRAGAYGSSFMFEVLGESWNMEPEESDYNPRALPERTITEVRLHEAGPVTFPANPGATAGVRSGLDWYGASVQARDAERHSELVRSWAAWRTAHGLTVPASAAPEDSASGTSPARPSEGRLSRKARERRLLLTKINGRGM